MGSFGALLWILHYVGLFVQLSAASQSSGDTEVDNHVSGNALFTEVPHDIITQSGQDVEMACSFRGAGSSSVSLEIQWWYLRQHREWAEKPAWTANQVASVEEMPRDATKISVVKVAGSNISHRLRLSSVKPADEGTYECRVIDFSDNHAQHHRVHAYLQVQPPGSGVQLSEGQNLLQESHHLQKGYSQVTDREMQKKTGQHEEELQHGDHKLHHQVHHKSHDNDPANREGLPPAPHHGEHHRQGHHHHLHDGGHDRPQGQDAHHQMSKIAQASKKSPAKSHQSEVKAHKGHAKGNSNDCSTDDCVL